MSEDPKDYLDFAGRQWMFQSCNEFGFYQTAHSKPQESARSSRIDLPYHHDACDRLFGIRTPVNTDQTNREYYSRLFDAGVKNIYFSNGMSDPWSNLSLTDSSAIQSANPGLGLFLIPGASHCDDLGSRITTALNQARSQFDALFSKWISE